ncbi:hypothetical protein B296_00047701 [Ensete ventricosum]|uniref:Uncharacterized protein n=1 Tax=Ensete ventricosum TaxID=4639 RepID=A0A426YJJ3_ENSVE|nr:hypothetical protein B296_00047701 [Ensete ventricosum]
MPGGRDYLDSKLVHGLLSPLQESRQLLLNRPYWWGFKLKWSVHPISNVASYLSEEDPILVGRLKGILSSSRAIREMIELWLVDVGLSPPFRELKSGGGPEVVAITKQWAVDLEKEIEQLRAKRDEAIQ